MRSHSTAILAIRKDLDIWIEPVGENAARVLRALEAFGFGALGLKEADFLVPDQVVQLGVPPNRIDLLSTLAGVEFPSRYASRQRTVIDETPVDFIDIENLKRNKKASGRHQDLADIENLQNLEEK